MATYNNFKDKNEIRAQFNKFGRIEDTGPASTENVIWEVGGNYTFLSSAETLTIVSTQAADSAAGTGARQITLYGVDGSYNRVNEVVTMNGLTPVVTTKSFFRINRVLVDQAGSAETNVGIITCKGTVSTGVTVAAVYPGEGSTLQCVFTVPNGETAWITEIYASVLKRVSAGADIELYTRVNGGAWQERFSVGIQSDGNSAMIRELNTPIYIPEKSDIKMVCECNQISCDVSGGFSVELYNNNSR